MGSYREKEPYRRSIVEALYTLNSPPVASFDYAACNITELEGSPTGASRAAGMFDGTEMKRGNRIYTRNIP